MDDAYSDDPADAVYSYVENMPDGSLRLQGPYCIGCMNRKYRNAELAMGIQTVVHLSNGGHFEYICALACRNGSVTPFFDRNGGKLYVLCSCSNINCTKQKIVCTDYDVHAVNLSSSTPFGSKQPLLHGTDFGYEIPLTEAELSERVCELRGLMQRLTIKERLLLNDAARQRGWLVAHCTVCSSTKKNESYVQHVISESHLSTVKKYGRGISVGAADALLAMVRLAVADSKNTTKPVLSEVPFLNGTTESHGSLNWDALLPIVFDLRHQLYTVDIGLLPLLCDKGFLTSTTTTTCMHCDSDLNYRDVLVHVLSGKHLSVVIGRGRFFTQRDVDEMCGILEIIRIPHIKFYAEKMTERPISHLVLPFWGGHQRLDEDDKLTDSWLETELVKIRTRFENLKTYVKKVLVARGMAQVADGSVCCTLCDSNGIGEKLTGVFDIIEHSLKAHHISQVSLNNRVFSSSSDVRVLSEILDAASSLQSDELQDYRTYLKVIQLQSSPGEDAPPVPVYDMPSSEVIDASSSSHADELFDYRTYLKATHSCEDLPPASVTGMPSSAVIPNNRKNWPADHLLLSPGSDVRTAFFVDSEHTSLFRPLTAQEIGSVYEVFNWMMPRDLANHCKKLVGLQNVCPKHCDLCDKSFQCVCGFLRHLFCNGHKDSIIREGVAVTIPDVTYWVTSVHNCCAERKRVFPRWNILRMPFSQQDNSRDYYSLPKLPPFATATQAPKESQKAPSKAAPCTVLVDALTSGSPHDATKALHRERQTTDKKSRFDPFKAQFYHL